MKKMIALLIAVCMAACVAGPVFAQDNSAMTKLGRGVLNVVDAVTEIPGTIMRESNANGIGSGLTKGTFTGVINTVVRGVVGVYEVVTFPIPVPQGYEPILDEPQFLKTE